MEKYCTTWTTTSFSQMNRGALGRHLPPTPSRFNIGLRTRQDMGDLAWSDLFLGAAPLRGRTAANIERGGQRGVNATHVTPSAMQTRLPKSCARWCNIFSINCPEHYRRASYRKSNPKSYNISLPTLRAMQARNPCTMTPQPSGLTPERPTDKLK